MDLGMALTLIGTLTGVASVLVAVVQMRQSPTPALEGESGRVHGNGTDEDRRIPASDDSPPRNVTPVRPASTLCAPTGRLGEVHGREELLARLNHRLSAPDGRFQVLAGLGGTGKTTVALALADRAEGQGARVWWVSATEKASLMGSLLGLAVALGASPNHVEEARAGARDPADVLWERLEAESGWLLVFDNADDMDVIALGDTAVGDGSGWIRPTRAGLIVVTSRVVERRVWGRHADVHPLGCLDAATGARVLLDLVPWAGTAAEAGALSQRLGGLPLGLRQAGVYLGSPFAAERSFTSYLEGLNDRFPALLSAGSEPRSEVTQTWEVSLDALAAQGRAQARRLLRVLSCFAPSVEIGSPLMDLNTLSECLGRPGTAEVRAGLEALLSVGLLEWGATPNRRADAGVVVHPLVAAASRQHLTVQVASAAASLIRSATDRLRHDNPEDWSVWLSVFPHVRSLLTLSPAVLDDDGLATIAWAVVQTCSALRWSGAWAAPEELARSALHQAEQLGPDHEAVLALRYQRAISAVYQGRYGEAESELQDILRAQLCSLGPDHPATLTTRHEAAHVLVEQSRLAEAEAACRAVLRDQLRVLGPDHPETLATRHWLLRAVGEQGRPAEAEAGYREVLETRIRVLGPEHPYTLMTYNNLGLQIAHQGRFAEAEAVFSELVDTRVRVFGPQHPYTLQARSNRAWVVTCLGRYAEAEGELRSVLDIERRVLSPDHTNALDARCELAQAIAGQGRYEEAESELREVIEAEIRVLGPDHHLTGDARYELALTLVRLGRHQEAAEELRSLLAVRTRTLGTGHPRTVATRESLSSLDLRDV
ncbi:tetratricopeptide repeat protein [Streptomyces sp. NBC_01750]|uniref:tetratricopeptide repeat protein n=1 Tax=Streptomyces sp. NBC_01750 TaxID=2975928 RepID=UPI002DDB954C|nr:tetratricopeptide repeat protein [Streptomyces sp. NBC_01750]WSD37294.1 tetratricopeptide repeat protein [Streptomyces sp. NBC_01750]